MVTVDRLVEDEAEVLPETELVVFVLVEAVEDDVGVTDVSAVVFVEVSVVDKLVESDVEADPDVELAEFDVELIRVEVVLAEVDDVDILFDVDNDVSELDVLETDTVV